MNSVNNLLQILQLTHLKDNQFEGVSKTVGSPNVFGGQVLAQALNAAYRTIDNHRVLHSLHAYFLEAGHLDYPIHYDVSVMRNGGSFSVRRVTASQNEQTIFILSASFHKDEEGYAHQIAMKSDIKQPEDLMSWSDILNEYGSMLPPKTKTFLEIPRPVEFKPTHIPNPLDRKDLPPFTDIWFKLKGNIGNLELAIKQQILTYISDYNILSVAIQPHASKAHWGNLLTASLDHSMWFFRDFDLNDWLLFSLESPSTGNARGFAKGNIFTREGTLVASVAQEGLMRSITKS
ncbi:acyl-CoA thioesterase-2 [Bizionia echini]|uniref:Acyl-CoA thioesterase 2 n=1 Tax=Bizionia echini TaxID=649333 RepID=A0A1I4YNV3_9FLAO|nr:acyl-CoA thioesterase II [Bizionia echini]SFN39280.1 acyl-CoA thioesterase-2 [Bizionia echini]